MSYRKLSLINYYLGQGTDFESYYALLPGAVISTPVTISYVSQDEYEDITGEPWFDKVVNPDQDNSYTQNFDAFSIKASKWVNNNAKNAIQAMGGVEITATQDPQTEEWTFSGNANGISRLNPFTINQIKECVARLIRGWRNDLLPDWETNRNSAWYGGPNNTTQSNLNYEFVNQTLDKFATGYIVQSQVTDIWVEEQTTGINPIDFVKNLENTLASEFVTIATGQSITGKKTFTQTVTGVDPVSSTDLTTKQYVDNKTAEIDPDDYIKKENNENDVTDPTGPQDVATKNYVDNNASSNTVDVNVSDPTTESLSQTATTQQDINQENKTQIEQTTNLALVDQEVLTEWLNIQVSRNTESYVVLANSGSNGVWTLDQSALNFEIILANMSVNGVEYKIPLSTQLLYYQPLTFGPYTFTYDNNNLTLTVSPTTDITDYGEVAGFDIKRNASYQDVQNEANVRFNQDEFLQQQINEINTATENPSQSTLLGTWVIGQSFSTYQEFKNKFFGPNATNTNINIKDSTDTYWIDSEFYYDTQGNAYSSGYTSDTYGVTKWTNTLPNATFGAEASDQDFGTLRFTGFAGFPDSNYRFFNIVTNPNFSLQNVLPYGTGWKQNPLNIETKNNGLIAITNQNFSANPFLADLSDSLNQNCYGVPGFDVVQTSNKSLQPYDTITYYYIEDQNQNRLYPSVFGDNTIQSYGEMTFSFPSGDFILGVSGLNQGVPVWVKDDQNNNLIQVQISPYNPNQLQLLQWNENNSDIRAGTYIYVYGGGVVKSFETDQVTGEFTLLNTMDANGYNIINSPDPVNSQDVANKNYVDINSLQQLSLGNNVGGSTVSNSEVDIDVNNYPKISYPSLPSFSLNATYPNVIEVSNLWTEQKWVKLSGSFSATQNTGGSRDLTLRWYECDAVGNKVLPAIETATITITNGTTTVIPLSGMDTIATAQTKHYCFTVESEGGSTTFNGSQINLEINPAQTNTNPTAIEYIDE